jgi:DNA (cytosine-5)-methyltransferase 1
MRKGELAKRAGIGWSSLAKLGRNENVNVNILVKICQVLDCTMDDIIEVLPKKENTNEKQ